MALKAVRSSVKGKGLDYGVLLKISEGRSSLFLTLAYEIRKKWVEMSTLFFFNVYLCHTPPPPNIYNEFVEITIPNTCE